MNQSFLSVSFPIHVLETIVMKAVIADPGVTSSYLAENIASQHGVDTQEVVDCIMTQLRNGTLVNRNGELTKVEGLILKNGVAHIGGAA